MHNTIACHLTTDAQSLSSGCPQITSLQFQSSTWCHMLWNIPLASLDQLCWFCPSSCAPSTPSLAGQCEKLKCPQLRKHCSATATPLCYQRCFSPKSKDGIIPAAMKKTLSLLKPEQVKNLLGSNLERPILFWLSHVRKKKLISLSDCVYKQLLRHLLTRIGCSDTPKTFKSFITWKLWKSQTRNLLQGALWKMCHT